MRAVTLALLAVLTILLAAATPSGSANKASEAEVHLRKACEVVWTDATDYQIDRCTKRAMAAMGDENRLRDNELKRLLMSSERELETCKQELTRALGTQTDVADARHRPGTR